MRDDTDQSVQIVRKDAKLEINERHYYDIFLTNWPQYYTNTYIC